MKFTNMMYERPDTDEMRRKVAKEEKLLLTANSAEEAASCYQRTEKLFSHYNTMATLCMIRHSVDTRDEYYDKENDFFDEEAAAVSDMAQRIRQALCSSRFRSELEKRFGGLLFRNLEIANRTFSPEVAGDITEENKLASAYQKLYASAIVSFDGKEMPLPMLGPYKLSVDRAVRKAAYVAEGEFFDSHREELDQLYDDLVHCRNRIACKLGYKNFNYLAYDRLGRNCYGYEELKAFRRRVEEELVPYANLCREEQRKRIGVKNMHFYDLAFLFPDGNAAPVGSAADILQAGKEMYRELSPETSEFIDFMYENDLFDVLSKAGKAPGGYCTSLADYKAPFVFANFNGTAGDVDVLTHEMGHAFAAYRAYQNGVLPDYRDPTVDACEVHSMSMEFLTDPYYERFFGKNADKYRIAHASDALTFIPYGCMVDEFQHTMYEQEEMTPEERNRYWLSLEKKYRPYLDTSGLPFYSRGAGWQRQLHIYLYPLYYVDYCMAQTVAFQFFSLSRTDAKNAFRRYLSFVDMAGTETLEGLVQKSGLRLPYEPGALESAAKEITEYIFSSH